MFSVYESCAIESISSGNKGKVHVLVTNPLKYIDQHDLISDADDNIIKGYQPFQNDIDKINIDDFVKGTPIERIFTDSFLTIKSNRYKRIRESLKLAALYRFGGLVIDLEMLVAEPADITQVFGLNGATKIGFGALGGAIVALDKTTKIGRAILEKSFEILNEMRNEADLDIGFLLTKAYLALCYNKTFKECSDFHILETSYFYPLNLTENHKYFEAGDLIPNTYGYYIWDRSGTPPKPNSLYWKLMKEYCPNVHNLIKNKSSQSLRDV